MRAHPQLLFPLLLVATTAFGEQMYVDDKLVLSVYAEADQRSSRIATIQTGDAVEMLERVDKLVRVQLADGREGWVGASYLSAQPPAIVKLKELQSSADTPAGEPPRHLTDEIARLKKQNTTLQAQVIDLKKQVKTSPSTSPASSSSTPTSPMSATAAPPAHEASDPLPAPVPEPTIVIERSYWWAWVLAVLLAAGSGYFAGYETLGRRVRQRFGGVKVY